MHEKHEHRNKMVGFLHLLLTEAKDGFLSALLVTDIRGIPQEFRCTRPVKPTAIQQKLYGDKLKPYIAVNLCGVPLVESLENSPAAILVREKLLLGVRPFVEFPVIYVEKSGEAIEIQSVGLSNGGLRLKIESPGGRFQPVSCETHPDFHEDGETISDVLKEISENLDPLEPFGRILSAVKVIGQKDDRFV